jgi:hypothetical protein
MPGIEVGHDAGLAEYYVRAKSHDRINSLSHHRQQAHEAYGGRTSVENSRQNGDSRFMGGRPVPEAPQALDGRVTSRDAPIPEQAAPEQSFTVTERNVEQEQWRMLMEETPGDTLGSPATLDHALSPRAFLG